ncbi:polysaccharide biosynthesis protein [Poriferisphaera sp. WC338]|uniref:polysaccharide biosynthesis protein n=1 Tax=Poriferisphaera sp. WC338 TaxID=3425129 RepID=UPI003D817E48
MRKSEAKFEAEQKKNMENGCVAAMRVLVIGTAMSAVQVGRLVAVNGEGEMDVVGAITVRGERQEVEGIEVLGRLDDIERVVVETGVSEVLVSLPMRMGREMGDVTARLDRIGVVWHYLPTLSDQLNGRVKGPGAEHGTIGGGRRVSVNSHDPIDVAKLIDRQPKALDEEPIRKIVEGQCVLVTGAGGSIGSEIARIVCRYKPSRLVLVERSENSLFEIDRELRRVFGEVDVRTVLHDITKRERTMDLVEREGPGVIFHAAAHKHVPMMEDHASEAVENNYFGTRFLADAANACGVGRMVMISSDKAVNPTSVMGATKRLAERYIQWLNSKSETVFTMVRFGNVLGSACSVLPIWGEQLSRGGPITVTDERMTRYFMTIPEAAGLVLQAGAYAEGGEVFLLDMGEPIRVLDMAERFAMAHGYEPGLDVVIKITGVRPGEKLFEELAYDSEAMTKTGHESIRKWEMQTPTDEEMAKIVAAFDRLRDPGADGEKMWRGTDEMAVRGALRVAVPEMIVGEEKKVAV